MNFFTWRETEKLQQHWWLTKSLFKNSKVSLFFLSRYSKIIFFSAQYHDFSTSITKKTSLYHHHNLVLLVVSLISFSSKVLKYIMDDSMCQCEQLFVSSQFSFASISSCSLNFQPLLLFIHVLYFFFCWMMSDDVAKRNGGSHFKTSNIKASLVTMMISSRPYIFTSFLISHYFFSC